IFSGVSRLIANHPLLAVFESASEARALSSAGITRPLRSYDPVRLPHGPLPNTQRRSRDLRPRGSPPITRITLPTCRSHYPDGSNGRLCRLLPRPPGLPRCSGGSASISSLSRPAQALLTLRPAGSLNRPRRPLSRGSGPASHPARPLVSYQINRQLPGWNLPPLVKRAFGAHVESRKGAVAWPCGVAPFPFPAHQTGRARLRHPAFRLISSQGLRRRSNLHAVETLHAEVPEHFRI